MATNHRQQLDPAITRPGRFDLLLCVAPPTWEKKISANALEKIYSIEKPEEVEKELLRLVPVNPDARKTLDRFTVTEVGIFLDYLKRIQTNDDLRSALSRLAPPKFKKIAMEWSKTSITLRAGHRITTEYEDDLKASRRQYYPKQR